MASGFDSLPCAICGQARRTDAPRQPTPPEGETRPKNKWILLRTSAEDHDPSSAEVRRLTEDGELRARRDDPTGPLMISQGSLEDYREEEARDGDGDVADADFDSRYDEGWAGAMAEKERS